jgi:cytochrome b6-f complex iron-sulfur subunit
MKNTRREFCTRACALVPVATLAPILQGCGNPTAPSSVPEIPSLNPTLVNGTLVLAIDPGSPVERVGGAALLQTPAANVLIARTTPDSFVAVTATCTHFGCVVSGYQDQKYTCPCHGSEFSTSGAVVRGPANRPLRQYATSFVNNILTITL